MSNMGHGKKLWPIFVYVADIDNTKLMCYNMDARKELELFEI